MSIISEIKKDYMSVFRRVYLKRRQTDGNYESAWQEIPETLIEKYGAISFSIDDIIPNIYKASNFSFDVRNNTGYFADLSDNKSFWYGYLSKYRTLVKVEAGYVASDGATEYPSGSLFVGILAEDLVYTQDSKLSFPCKHISSVFDEFPADQITGLGVTQTASDVILKIRDYQDGGGTYYFRQYFSLGAWNIGTTTAYYNMATSTSLQNISVWKLMQKLAEAENYIVYVDRVGGFYFKPVSGVTTTVAFHFSGLGDTDHTYGHNVMDQISVDENVRKVYNRIRVKYANDDTTTSYYIKNEAWTWGDSSSSFLYGVREYKYENTWMSASIAASVADRIYDEFKWPKSEVKITSKFVPQLSVQDRTTLTYKTVQYTGSDLWGHFNYDDGIWGSRSGYNINIDNDEYRITSLDHNIDNFSTNVILRAL